jgi:hypothetical protein
VRGQILRFIRLRSGGEARRRADGRYTEISSDAHRDHVLCDLLAETDTSVMALRDDVR